MESGGSEAPHPPCEPAARQETEGLISAEQECCNNCLPGRGGQFSGGPTWASVGRAGHAPMGRYPCLLLALLLAACDILLLR
jgi:hypothetical protein